MHHTLVLAGEFNCGSLV